MKAEMVCARCNGYGSIFHYAENRAWSEPCDMCKGTGAFGEIDVDIDIVSITRQEYNELLEYKSMYERLCT